MGTFLGCVGQPHIPEDRQEAFRRCILRLFREGGMMSTEDTQLFGKKITLLYFPEPDENGCFWFNYNYYENDFWEDAGLHRGRVFSNKVGYMHFCRVMAAARVLEERSSDAPCFADLRDADIPHCFPLGWLKSLFGEELPLERPSLWDTYVLLKAEGRYGRYGRCGSSWDDILMRNAGVFRDWMDILAIRTAEHGTEEVLEEIGQYFEANAPEKTPAQEGSLLSDFTALREQIRSLPQHLPGAEDTQLSLVMAYLTELDGDTLFSMVLDERQPEAVRRLPFMQCYLPRQIIVKAVAETYHRDFWELWEQVKTGYACRFCRKCSKQGETPIEPIPTDDYLNLTPDDRLFCLPPEELEAVSPETRAWLDSLKACFERRLQQPPPCSDAIAFQSHMIETLYDAKKRKAHIWAFRDMFYEFLANWAQPEYQALWALFAEMSATEETDSSRLRQYLALLANPPLRKAVLGA